ncbi:type II toxin-antitoxin system VapC family toxin [Halapricum desulfuricans]|uniref:type II toxin-antitoxin system VapC family toxin n=1 Tax=Halapricum desulfuricans TaxID=2841257 RepID=UPI002B4BE07F|nr:PIN domain-containing protein [Halapricum desulfuricans]
MNWIHERQRHNIAVDLRTRLSESAGFELVHAAQKDFHRAVELFEIYDKVSFGDATIAAYMERKGIEYLYSFDDDFDTIDGITRLETPDDPFI